MDSQKLVNALVEVDPGFVALCDTLFGKAADAAEIWEFIYTAEGISKMGPSSPDVSSMGGIKKPANGVLVPKMTNLTPPKPPAVPQGAKPVPLVPKVSAASKALDEDGVDLVWSGEFSKFDDDKRQAFGWASIVEVNGRPVVDLQGDLITPDDLEIAAYSFVRKSRVGGSQHARDEYDRPIQAGELIESKVWTDEKYEAFAKSGGVPYETFANAPRGWEAGFQYDDEPTWIDIRTGRKTGFSIHGRGKRVPVDA